MDTSRITSQQQAVHRIITSSDGHQTAEQVHQQVKKSIPRVSLATVYRNLEKLTTKGMIQKVSINGVFYFEAERQPHYHVVCLSCKRVENIMTGQASDIEDFFGRETDFRLTGHDLVLYGVCPMCQKRR
jgi:Fe2+ or Zn2+ uptake regulation protein